jgi:hypothetical protein
MSNLPMKTLNRLGALLLTAILLSACSSAPAESWTTVTLNGTVKMVAGPLPAGKLHFRLYALESGSGELQHPLEEIEDFESDTPSFSHTFEYPNHKGEGLAIHAWLDTDADGVFCTPSVRTDPSGLSWDAATPEGEVNMTITLTNNCRAANWFYPPAP